MQKKKLVSFPWLPSTFNLGCKKRAAGIGVFSLIRSRAESEVSGVEGDICGKVKEEDHFLGGNRNGSGQHIDNPSPGSPLLLW